MQFSFALPTPFFSVGALRFACKVYTLENVYFPEKERFSLTKDDAGITRFQAERLISMEENGHGTGRLWGEVSHRANDYGLTLHAEHNERIRALGLVIAGVHGERITTLESVKEFPIRLTPFREVALTYPIITTPLTFLHNGEDVYDNFYFRFEDTSFTFKRFLFRKTEEGKTFVEMVYEANAREFAKTLSTCQLNCGHVKDVRHIATLQVNHLKYNANIKERYEKTMRPAFADRLNLVARFHFTHHTGKTFLTFETAKEAILHLRRLFPTNALLVKLSGWDGRYYKTLPHFMPSVELGGEQRFREFIAFAHKQKVAVAPEVSVRYADRAALAELDLKGALAQDAYRRPLSFPAIDFLSLGAMENALVPVSLSHEGYYRHVLAALKRVLEYGADGFFFADTLIRENESTGVFYTAFMHLLSDLREGKTECFFGAEHVIDLLANYITISESGDVAGGIPIFGENITRLYPNSFFRFVHLVTSRLTPDDNGRVGVEPFGYHRPFPGNTQGRVIPLLNVLSHEDLTENNPYVTRVRTEALRYASFLG